MAVAFPAYDHGETLDSLCSGANHQMHPPAIVEFFDPGFFAYKGSGSTNWHEFFSNISGSPVQGNEDGYRGNSIERIQKTIASTFGITMDDLAYYCGTTRRSLYNWRIGVAPRNKAAKKMFDLYRVAKDWRESGVGIPKAFRYEKSLNGKSLDDLLSEEQIDVEAIAFVRTRFQLELMEEMLLTDPFEE
jgi:hypothetical protein